MYSGGGDITTNIDVYGGKGTANFVSDAIEIYCDNAEKFRRYDILKDNGRISHKQAVEKACQEYVYF